MWHSDWLDITAVLIGTLCIHHGKSQCPKRPQLSIISNLFRLVTAQRNSHPLHHIKRNTTIGMWFSQFLFKPFSQKLIFCYIQLHKEWLKKKAKWNIRSKHITLLGCDKHRHVFHCVLRGFRFPLRYLLRFLSSAM